jgi:hypothetical protein
VNTIDFTTSSPGISASFRWATIQQQDHPLQFSRLQLRRNRAAHNISGITDNVRLLKFDLHEFVAGTPVQINLDGAAAITYTTKSNRDSVLLLKTGKQWMLAVQSDSWQKGPQRYGTFKDAFNHNMIFVYGTTGTAAENAWSLGKARFDAETWYYRGNGAVDMIADKDFTIDKYKDRGVILFGNRSSNSAWGALLGDCPIQVDRNKITAGAKSWQGDDLAAYFIWPIRSSAIASVAVISGSGVKGMQAASANQYFAGASGFPDFMIYGLKLLQNGAPELKMAGFYDYNWQLSEEESGTN